MLDVTEQLLREGAGAKLTIGGIAAAAGLSRSSVYFYFDDKESILIATAHRAVGPLLEAQDRLIREHNGWVAAAESVLSHTFEMWRTQVPLLTAVMELSVGSPTFREAWRGYMERVGDRVAEALEQDRAAGVVTCDIDALRPALRSMVWMVERSCFMLFSREHTAEDERLLYDALMTVWFHTLGIPRNPE